MFLPVKFTMFPSDDTDFFNISIKSEPWTYTEETSFISKDIEKKLSKIPEVKYVQASIQTNKSFISVELIKSKEREEMWLRTSVDIIKKLQKEFKIYKNFIVTVEEIKKWPAWGSPVSFRIVMNDAKLMSEAEDVMEDIKSFLRKIPWTDWVSDDFNETPWEITYAINRSKALALWVNPDWIWIIVRSTIEWIEATEVTQNWKDVKVTVKYKQWAIKNFDDIWEIQIINNQWKSISLSQVVDKKLNSSLMNIKRVDWDIAITVNSNLNSEWNAMEVTTKLEEILQTYETPDWISIINAWENKENTDLFMALLTGSIIAVFLIFTILVIQFDSFTLPLIILFTIIMAQTWVNFWLFITWTERSLAFIIWIISLAWIVVNDAIILIDRINNLRKQNPLTKLSEIIAKAWESRLQPIILTTLTTTAGIAPLIFVDQFWKGLAITIIFWLMVASTLTLFITPVLYHAFYWKKTDREK